MEVSNIHQEINITPELSARIEELCSHYPAEKRKSALLPVPVSYTHLTLPTKA